MCDILKLLVAEHLARKNLAPSHLENHDKIIAYLRSY